MDSDLAVRRRALGIVYRRYVEADRQWTEAVRGVMSWFPSSERLHPVALGNPGSPVRRLYDRRERAIAQLEVAVLKLKVAKARLATRRPTAGRVRALPHRRLIG